jgi:probable phosphoglycerate mutase
MGHAEATRVFAIRHGETAWNVDTRIQGQLDVALNDHGRWQAERVADALAAERLDAVYTSDLQRARATALPIAARQALEPILDAGLRERAFGVFEGVTWNEVASRHPAEAERWRRRDPDFGPAGGERLADFYGRAVAAAARIALAHRGQAIAIVAHGGVLDCLYRAATGQALTAPRTWLLGNAGINRLLHAGERFTLVGWGDTAHLERPGEDAAQEGG